MRNTVDQYPNTLSPDFIPKALARLLPDPQTLTTKTQLEAFFQETARLERKIINNPLLFFAPNPGGQADFLTFNDPAVQGLYFFAGNKTGKTTGALVNMLERACGKALWGLPARAHLHWRAPTRGAIFCEDFDTHREDILPRLFTWCPRNELARNAVENGASGNPARVNFANGTIVNLRTYEQGYEKAEGKDYDWVLCNEPPPRDIYTAIWRGFTATHGVMWIAATLLAQTWLYDESAQPFIRVFEADMYQNTWLSTEARQNFEAMLDESERAVRIYGRPSNLSGMVYPNFKDHEPFIVEDQNPPWDVITDRPWPIIMGVDPHERRGIYAEWAYVSPLNEIIWFDWAVIPTGSLTLDATFELLKEKEREHIGLSSLIVMDPNRGVAVQMGGHSWEDEFMARDFPVQLGIDDVSFGHAQMRDYLFGVKPKMRWMRKCLGQGGPVWQMQRYIYDDWQRGSFKERERKERVKDVNKDFPDVHRYVACARLEYRLLLGENQGIMTLNGRSPSDRSNAYLGRVASRALKQWA